MMALDEFDYESYYLTWYDSNYGDDRLYGEPLFSTQDGPNDDPYYLAYDEDGMEAPYSGSGSWLGDYTSYFGSYWGENENNNQRYGDHGSSLEKEEIPLFLSLFEGDKYGNYNSFNNNVQQDYTENQWPGYGGLGLGGGNDEYFDDLENQELPYNSSWDEWEERGLFDRIFGH